MPPDPADLAAPRHILVIDQDGGFLQLLRLVLEEECYAVTTGHSLRRTIQQLSLAKPDLIVFDLAACEGEWEQFRRLESEAAARPVPIILTGFDWHLIQQAIAHSETRQHRYLKKPFDLDDLIRVVVEEIGPAQATPSDSRPGDGET